MPETLDSGTELTSRLSEQVNRSQKDHLETKEEVGILQQIPSSKTEMPKPIIVKFINRWNEEEIVEAERMKRHLTTEDLKLTGKVHAIYINEHLTVRAYQYIWTRDCKVFARKDDSSRVVHI
ncbi:hypothetical protein PR048_032614, partial [Dryococelus australis]